MAGRPLLEWEGKKCGFPGLDSTERLVITEAENVEVVIVEVKIVILILISGVRRCKEIHVTTTDSGRKWP